MAVINTNIKAIVAQESSRQVNLKLATAMERLSTGLRINSAKDDAAGLAISERMNAQVRGLGMAIKNASDGLSMAQTADGAYGEVTSMLQRMRELAVQAATGSMSPLDRQSLQLEVSELKTEIENVATKTHFNGIKLLDGTARSVNLQIGANEGDLMSIGFDSVRTKDIGSGLRPALTSVGGESTVFDAIVSGDLILNGSVVNASLADDDAASYDAAASSAIAKVAAINRVTEQSGVFALVNETTVQGSTMTAPAASLTAGSITINGVASAEISLGTDNSINRTAVLTAINNIADQTGVRAVDTGDDQQGVMLITDDGRNVTIAFAQSLTTANTGLGAAATHVGTYSLYSTSGEAIRVSHSIGGDITGTGLRMGVYQPDTAAMTTLERSGDGVASAGPATPLPANSTPSTANVGVLNGDTLVINDIAIDAARTTDDSASFSSTGSAKAASAIAIAAAINKKTELHGVKATAEPNVIRSETASNFTAASTSGQLFINGTTVTVTPASRDGVIESINAVSGLTGVVAREFGQGVELVAEDGRNIALTLSTGISAANLGLAGVTVGAGSASAVTADSTVTFYSSVSLTSDKAFNVTRGSEGGSNFSRLGFREGTFGGSDTGVKIAEIDISRQQGASSAITAIDAALEDVYAAQAKSGAYQNRLDAVINVQSEASENLTASRSRIMDTDYALEATNLAKAQIVAQAATAMLAQANQSQQTVLQLLQG
ncbi:MAG: flagellin [Proteobacteria bacterium]|nr:flagellin [Pseudomonadota bacterium]